MLRPPTPERTVRCTEAVALVYRRVRTLRLLHSVLGSARAAHMSKDSFNTAHFSLLLFFIPVTTGAEVNLQYPCYQLTAQLTSASPVAGSEPCLRVCEALRSVPPGDDLSETTRRVLTLQGGAVPQLPVELCFSLCFCLHPSLNSKIYIKLPLRQATAPHPYQALRNKLIFFLSET